MLMLPAAQRILRDELDAVAAVAPAGTSAIYRPIRHSDLVKEIHDAAGRFGYPVARAEYGVMGKEKEDLFGSLTFDPRPGLDDGLAKLAPGGLRFALGFRHSNRLRYALTIVVGAEVRVCSNGMISGDFVVKRKHTVGYDLRAEIEAAFSRWQATVAGEIRATVEKLEQIDFGGDVGRRGVDRLLIEAARKDVVPWSTLGRVDEAWRKPPHPEFAPRTGWSLYNAFTEVVKEAPAPRQIHALREARRHILDWSVEEGFATAF